ncbi:ferredoxin [Patescibacteria group bacterium]|nr:ferredoxin [Patescibacteria group bacterium]
MCQEPTSSFADASEDKENQQPKGKKPLKIGKIIVDRNLCIGNGSCVAVAPGVFELDSENKAVVYNSKGADDETILLAAKSCPTQAILIFDEDGNQIFP